MNVSTKTINGIDVILRNYRNADGDGVTNVLCSLTSHDGKSAPISLNPFVPTYFKFAWLVEAINGTLHIALAPTGLMVGIEAGVKLGVSGEDIPGSRIDFRLKVLNDKSLSIEPWQLNRPAVGAGGV